MTSSGPRLALVAVLAFLVNSAMAQDTGKTRTERQRGRRASERRTVRVEEARPENGVGDTDELQLRVLCLKYAEADQTARLLHQLTRSLNPRGPVAVTVTADEQTNSLLLAGSQEMLDATSALAAELDQAHAAENVPETIVQVVQLKHARAKSVTNELQQFFPNQHKLRFTAESNSNAIILEGQRASLDKVFDLVSTIDQRAGERTQAQDRVLRFYPLKYANAPDTAAIIDVTLVAMGFEDVHVLGDLRSATILTCATPDETVHIEAILAALDVEADAPDEKPE